MMGSIFYEEVQYPVQDPEPKEQLKIEPLPNLKQDTYQYTVKDTDPE